jgi:hypothetical protein
MSNGWVTARSIYGPGLTRVNGGVLYGAGVAAVLRAGAVSVGSCDRLI